MTPAHFNRALTSIGWSGEAFARASGRDPRTVRRWISGEYGLPADLAAWTEMLATFHEQHPPPGPRRHPDAV